MLEIHSLFKEFANFEETLFSTKIRCYGKIKGRD